jgi:hypothetical protein
MLLIELHSMLPALPEIRENVPTFLQLALLAAAARKTRRCQQSIGGQFLRRRQ